MTIKKRLFISNILMIIIPAVLAVAILAGCLFLFWISIFPHAEYRLGFQEELIETRYKAVALASDWLAQTPSDQKSEEADALLQLVDTNQLTLQIYQGSSIIQQFGTNNISSQEQLEQALTALDGAGTVSDGAFDLFGKQVLVNGTAYQIHLYNPVVTLSNETLKAWAIGIGFFMIIILLFIIFLTNRFLIRFVFRRISDPLQTLAEGVHQIQDGHLTHQITYTEQDEFGPVCEDFNEMARRLRDSVERSQKEEESRKELLASISHDIRSPLTCIRAYVEGLLDGVADTPEKQAMYLRTIQKKSEEIDQMVKQLFLFSKMELEEYPYNPETLDAAEEISDFVFAAVEEYRQRGLEIKKPVIPKHVLIEADPIYFGSILQNLLDNSAKYKDKETGTVFIKGEIQHQSFRLCVEDDGPGVPEDALIKLFDVFYRNDPSRNTPNQGSGLGLAIVSKAVTRMGGHIHAENRTEGGLRIVLELPLAKGENEA